MARNRVDALADKVFEAADDALAFMEEKLVRIEGAFQNSSTRIELLSVGVNRLSQKETEARAEAVSLLKTLDEEVFERLKSAQVWLDSTHAVAVSVGKISEAVVSSKYAASHEDSMGVAMAEQLQELSEAVVEILTTLNEARQGLVDIRDDVLSARRIAQMIATRFARVEERMANLCGRIEKFHARVAATRGEIAAARSDFRWWTTLGAVLIAMLLAWVAASQVGMVLRGWSLAKRQAP
jgi:DNA repair ATPase RecN